MIKSACRPKGCELSSRIPDDVALWESRNGMEMESASETLQTAGTNCFLLLSCSVQSPGQAEKTSYSAMAPVGQYLVADKNAEIPLARSAAPASVSDGAKVLILGRDGLETGMKGTNGFVCVVERSWGASRLSRVLESQSTCPHCFNSAAATTFLPIFLMKTRLALAGKSPAGIAATIASALEKRELPPLAPGAMVYMMSKEQYLNDTGTSWHPHVMFIVSGDDEKSRGANLPGSPVIAAADPEERVTIFMLIVREWSDSTPGHRQCTNPNGR